MREFKLGRLAGLSLYVEPLAILGSLLLLIVLSVMAAGVLHLSTWQAIAGSALAVILHWVSFTAHHIGHAWAARRTGYPMSGIRYGRFGLLGASLYPHGEPPLPAAIHIRRALGGPLGSLLFSLIAGVTALALRPFGDVLWWVGVFFFLENVILFSLGALLPLGFTDGSTLLTWWGKR